MIEKVYPGIFQIKIKLPNNPLKELNSYLIKGDDKSLLIDTGFNREECKEDLFEALKELDIDLDKLDVFITHLHADHSGNVSEFIKTSPKIYASEPDGKMINDMVIDQHWKDMEKDMLLCGLGIDNVKYTDHPAYKFRLSEPVDFTFLGEGDYLKVGAYNFKVISTPGHTPGQIGLYEEEHKLYFSGDHILDIITPNIAFWSVESEDLKTYIKELDKMKELEIDYIFPAHRNIMTDHPRRAIEIKEHHFERIEEVYNLLKEEPQTVRDIAAKMTWRIRANDWSEFPPAQKWFASGEALSHLEYLHGEGKAKKILEDDLLKYSI